MPVIPPATEGPSGDPSPLWQGVSVAAAAAAAARSALLIWQIVMYVVVVGGWGGGDSQLPAAKAIVQQVVQLELDFCNMAYTGDTPSSL